MNRMRGRATALGAAALLAVSGVGLAGCSGGDSEATIVTDDGTVSVQKEDDKIEITTSEGSMTINGESDGELPAGWPAEVPVPAGGTVLSGLAMTGSDQEGWTASLSYPDSTAAQVSAEVASLLGAQGFESVSEIAMGQGTMSALSGEGFAITALVSEEDAGAMLVMTVSVEG